MRVKCPTVNTDGEGDIKAYLLMAAGHKIQFGGMF